MNADTFRSAQRVIPAIAEVLESEGVPEINDEHSQKVLRRLWEVVSAEIGQRKVIETSYERDELPNGAVVRSAAGTIASLENGQAVLFGMTHRPQAQVLQLPLTVLYDPTEPAKDNAHE